MPKPKPKTAQTVWISRGVTLSVSQKKELLESLNFDSYFISVDDTGIVLPLDSDALALECPEDVETITKQHIITTEVFADIELAMSSYENDAANLNVLPGDADFRYAAEQTLDKTEKLLRFLQSQNDHTRDVFLLEGADLSKLERRLLKTQMAARVIQNSYTKPQNSGNTTNNALRMLIEELRRIFAMYYQKLNIEDMDESISEYLEQSMNDEKRSGNHLSDYQKEEVHFIELVLKFMGLKTAENIRRYFT